MVAAKPPRESRVEMTEVVLPSDANPHGTVFGGKVMQWIDICGALASGRHCRKPVVTASIDDLHFHAPINVGEAAVLVGRVLAAFRSSMECEVTVHSENMLTGERKLCTSAFITFVALSGRGGTPVEVPPVLPETDEERRLFEEASARRQDRLARARQRRPEVK